MLIWHETLDDPGLPGRGEYFGFGAKDFRVGSFLAMGGHSENFRSLGPTGAKILQAPTGSTEWFRRSSWTKTAIFRFLLGLET